MKKVIKTEDAWREQLDEGQFQVCRMRGTERPFTGAHTDNKAAALYRRLLRQHHSRRLPLRRL